MSCGIYKITNLVNGKIYVGQSEDSRNTYMQMMILLFIKQ